MQESGCASQVVPVPTPESQWHQIENDYAMKELSFTYLRKTYRGFLAASTQAYPHLYWYFMEDPELCEELGDCLCFRRQVPAHWSP